MANTGKKGKKSKGTVFSLQSFLSNGNDVPLGTTQVAKMVRNYDGEDSDDGGSSIPLVVELPNAPRANRAFEDDSVSHTPPFRAYITNLSFLANEQDVTDFFGDITISSLRLPREGDTGRFRGFGYVEFESRDDLIQALSIPDPTIKGRRIRIELASMGEPGNRQRSNRRYDGFNNSSEENRDSTNWRRDNQMQESNSSSGGGGGGFDRGYFRERRTDSSQDNSTPGSWRSGCRSGGNDKSPIRGNYSMEKFRDSNNEWTRGVGNANQGENAAQERPKLIINPRTLPLPEIQVKVEPQIEMETEKAKEKETTADNDDDDDGEEKQATKPSTTSGGVPAVNVFGAAKPVDTASRELEIEERLAQSRRDEQLKKAQEQKQRESDVNEKLAEVQLEKLDKENTNSAISWRCKDESENNKKGDNRAYNADKRSFTRKTTDERRRGDSKDFNRENKNYDRDEQFIEELGQSREIKEEKEEESDINHHSKTEHPIPKLQRSHEEPSLQESNKYSGLDEILDGI